MEQLNILSDFFSAIQDDGRIGITHIGVYSALLQYWYGHHCENPMRVFSHEIMQIAKISSAATYCKCVKQLSDYGYIKYEPSFKKNRGSKIYFLEND